MGKKKDERKRREREERERVREAAARAETLHAGTGDRSEEREPADRKHDHDKKHADHKHRDHKHGGAAPFAGIAASFVKQLETPLGRQIIAAGLMAAAGAISRQDTKTAARPAPPTPHTPPTPETPPVAATSAEAAPDANTAPGANSSTGPFAGKTGEPPRSDTAALPPEMAKVIDSVAVGLGRLFNGFGKTAGEGSSKDTPPKG